jgi:hypothetical protein
VSFPTRRVYRPRAAFGSKHQAAGLLRADGKAVRDDNGRFFPLSTSFFPWWWAYKHDRDRGLQNLAAIAPWADEMRNFGEVGGASWEDRVIDPRSSDYEDIGKAATDEAFDNYGTRTQLTVFGGGTGADPDMTIGKVINIMRGRVEAFSSVELSNEGNGIDQATQRRLAQRLRAEFSGLLVATTSDIEGSDLDVASMATTHSERQSGDEDWRQVRQGCEMMGVHSVVDYNEPPGFESSVAVLHDPLRLASLRLVAACCGSVRYCHHTGAGVRLGGAADLSRGRASNFWEYDGSSANRPSMEAAVAAYRQIEKLVPEDVPNWRGVKGHWPDTRLFADMIWSDNSEAFDHVCVRVYGGYADSGYAEMVIGVRRFVNLTQKAGAYDVSAFDVLSGEAVLARPVADGETFRLEGDPLVWGSAPNQAGSSRAYLVVGSRR